MVFGLSSGESCDSPAIICHRVEVSTKWKTGSQEQAAESLRILRRGRLGAGLVAHVAGAIERANNEASEEPALGPQRDPRAGLVGPWPPTVVRARAPEFSVSAGEKISKDQETSHSLFRSAVEPLSQQSVAPPSHPSGDLSTHTASRKNAIRADKVKASHIRPRTCAATLTEWNCAPQAARSRGRSCDWKSPSQSAWKSMWCASSRRSGRRRFPARVSRARVQKTVVGRADQFCNDQEL